MKDGNVTLFLSHGHIFMPECFPAEALHTLSPGDPELDGIPVNAYIYGHTHIWKLEKNFKGILLVNPGSTSLPKGGNPPTFGLYESATGSSPAKFSIHRLDDGSELASAEL